MSSSRHCGVGVIVDGVLLRLYLHVTESEPQTLVALFFVSHPSFGCTWLSLSRNVEDEFDLDVAYGHLFAGNIESCILSKWILYPTCHKRLVFVLTW